MKNITLQEIATKLNGKYWSKDGKERVYLDRGHNTKKMSTSTYVEMKDGVFVVRCYIDCPSQSDNWVKTQQQEIIELVCSQIDEIVELSKLSLVKYQVDEESDFSTMVYVKYQEEYPIWYTEDIFYNKFGFYPQDIFEGLPRYEKIEEECTHD